MVAWRWVSREKGQEREMKLKRNEETLGSDSNVQQLDYGEGFTGIYIDQKSSACIHFKYL